MNDEGNNPQHHPAVAEPGDILRQACQKASELAALLARLAQLSGDKRQPASGGAGTSTLSVISQTATPAQRGRPPALQKHDMQAYQLSAFVGLKQSEVASRLNAEHGTTYCQGQVSKMIRRARVHMRATGLQLAGAQAAPARSVDPAALELGPRTDGRRTDGRRSKRGADNE